MITKWVALADQLANRTLVKGSRDQQNDVVDHVRVPEC